MRHGVRLSTTPTATINTSVTSRLAISLCIDQPTAQCEYKSSTTETYNQLSAVQRDVKSATYFWFELFAWNCRSSTLSAIAAVWRRPGAPGVPMRTSDARWCRLQR